MPSNQLTHEEIRECERLSRATASVLDQLSREVFATEYLREQAFLYCLDNLQSALAILVQTL